MLKPQITLISILKKTSSILFLIISIQMDEAAALSGHDSVIWTGYDFSDGSEIEIGSGNLVREGEEIRFYDWKNEEDRRADVVDVEYLFNRTRLEIYDYSAKKNRIFEMNH